MNSKLEWDLSPLLAGENDPSIETKRAALRAVVDGFVAKWKGRDDYLKDPAVLREALDEYEAWQHAYGTDGDEGFYFGLRSEQDENDPVVKAGYKKSEDFSRKVLDVMQFFELRIARIPASEQQRFLDASELEPYRHFLELRFREARYVLSEAEEKILNAKGSVSYGNWVRMTSSFIAREERALSPGGERKSFSELLSLIDSTDKNTRDAAAREVNGIFREHIDAGEAEMNAILENKMIDDELRGVDRPDRMRHLADDIESEVVDVLIDTVAEHYDVAHRYYALKAKLLGVPRLQYHERNIPVGSLDATYSWDEAVTLTRSVFQKLDPEFVRILDRFLANGQIDVFPRKGKRSGAFCAAVLLTQPTYVLLNFTGKLRDVETLAHEMGHAINDELMRDRQHALNFATPLSTAEVASTFMEDFVIEELEKGVSDEDRLSLMMQKAGNDVSTIFRQSACYRFERELHDTFRRERYLTKEAIGNLFRTHMSAYMGDAVEQSEGSENWWLYWNHIRVFFYVYSYVSGLLISKSLQSSVRADSAFIARVKEFLAAGRSDAPRSIFKKLGIDIAEKSFWERGIGETERLIADAEALAKKLGKI